MTTPFSGSSKKTYLVVFYYNGTDRAKGPDHWTDIVKPISPIINGDISFVFISTDIVKPICLIINGLIGFTISVTGPGTDIVNWTDIVKLICTIINGDIGFVFIGTDIVISVMGAVTDIVMPINPFINGLIGFGYIGFHKTTQSGCSTTQSGCSTPF
jgi:hypothetical protein